MTDYERKIKIGKAIDNALNSFLDHPVIYQMGPECAYHDVGAAFLHQGLQPDDLFTRSELAPYLEPIAEEPIT